MASPEKNAVFPSKITKQLEYYFGDKNLPKDKFLLQKIEEDDGWVTMDCLLTFERMKAIFRDIIGDSLHTHGSGLLEVDKFKMKLRRVKPLPEINDEYNSLAKEKTVYCKGFPETATLDEIEEFFEDKGKCVLIKMRRNIDENKTFKGSVFVEFETKEEASSFIASKDLKYKDNELVYMKKDEYFKGKKEKSANERNQTKNVQDQSTVKDEVPKVDDSPKGRVIHFSGAGDQTSREDLREIFNIEDCSVVWVNFSKGDTEGFVRYAKDGDGEKAMEAVLKKNENKLSLRGVETTLRVIEGDQEKNYWKKENEEKQKYKRGGRKSHHRGGGHMKRARYEGKTKDEPPAKQTKTET